jgi:uncharacterized membrane protein YkoI
MTRKLLVGAVAAGALIITTGTAFALTSNDAPSTRAAQPTTFTSTSESTSESTSVPTGTSTPEASTGLSADDASRIATERVGGTVREVELELEHGRIEWKVDIIGADGVRHDVRIDAETGAITRIDADDRGDDDRGGDDHGGRDGGFDDNPGGHDRGGDDHGGRHRGGDDH